MQTNELPRWSFNLWLSYALVAVTIGTYDSVAMLAFTVGAAGSQLVLLAMVEDVKKLTEKGVKSVKFGFYKRYLLNAVVLGFSCTLGMKGLIFAFFGLYLTRLTLTTSLREW